MMESYFNVFKANSVQLGASFEGTRRVDDQDRERLIAAVKTSSNAPAPSVVLTVSDEAMAKSVMPNIPVEPKSAVYEPSEGVMVKKETISYLGQYEGMDKRISLVQVENPAYASSSDDLQAILTNIESQSFNAAKILSHAGAYDSNQESVSISGRVEIGSPRGGDFLFDHDGNIIGQKMTSSGWFSEVSNETSSQLTLTTNSGAKVNFELLIKDQMNGQNSKGLSRDVNLIYRASQELTVEEKTAVNNIVENFSELASSFQEGISVKQEDIDALAVSIDKERDVISSIGGSLSFEEGLFKRKIGLTSINAHSGLSTSITENKMDEAANAYLGRRGNLQAFMGDISTKKEYEAHNELLGSAWDGQADIYNDAILISGPKKQYMPGQYMASFLES